MNGPAEARCLVEPNDQSYGNLDPVYLDESHITYLSVPKGKTLEASARYILDVNSGEAREVFLEFEERKELIKFFSRIYN